MSAVETREHPRYGRGMMEDRFDGPLDSQGVVLASGDVVYVEGTDRGAFGNDWVGCLARVTSCPTSYARAAAEPVTDPADVRVGLEKLTRPGHTWGLPARYLRKLNLDDAVGLRLQIAERLRAISEHDAAALRAAERAAVERALVGELRARLAAIEAREDVS